MTVPNLFFFGYGYVAQQLHQALPPSTQVAGCTRSTTNKDFLYPFATIPQDILDQFDHFLISIPPDDQGDITLQTYTEYFKNRSLSVRWVCYLSATSVYGDHQGEWIDEATAPAPSSTRGYNRLMAEQQWQQLNVPLTILRLSGIYGPGRSAIESVLSHKAQLVNKPGHVFNRIHVADICRVILTAADEQPHVLNLADDYPAPLHEVYQYAYGLLSLPVPPVISWKDANLSEMAQDFFSENKRIKNGLIKKILKNNLLYPSYKEGLSDCLKWHQEKLKKST